MDADVLTTPLQMIYSSPLFARIGPTLGFLGTERVDAGLSQGRRVLLDGF